MPNIINLNDVPEWALARKVSALKAKPVSHAVDPYLLPHLVLRTLEGDIGLVADTVICFGAIQEPWFQKQTSLDKKYDRGVTDEAGWTVWTPKAENAVECVQINGLDDQDEWYVEGQWGAVVDGIERLQRVRTGDFICRQTYDATDAWVVQGKLFEATYQVA